jgi:probable phosphoglycerate mutase
MKRVYFVRHGESEGNVGMAWQTWDSPLTEHGREQARFVAQRCTRLPLEHIIASPFPRAKETAEIISKEINIPIEFSDLFVERRRPSEQIGERRDDDSIDLEIIKHWHEPDWRYSDEENFFDVRDRAFEALRLLEEKEYNHILVVTHGLFLKILLGCAIFEERFTPEESGTFIRRFLTGNTGLSILEYVPIEGKNSWRVVVWNDHAHLG